MEKHRLIWTVIGYRKTKQKENKKKKQQKKGLFGTMKNSLNFCRDNSRTKTNQKSFRELK